MADPRKPGDIVSAPWTGAVPAGGVASIIRIPVPSTHNLAIELSPRNFKGKTTSAIFIQDVSGKKVLRLDYGYNIRSKTIDYHWNQKGTFKDFKIQDHATVGRGGTALYQGARAFKYVGRTLVVVGVAVDAISIATASNPLRRSTEVVSAWALSLASARAAGAIGAEVGTLVEPGGGTAVVGLVFAIAGGIGGYWAGSKAGAEVYDWAANTVFKPLPEVSLQGQVATALPGAKMPPAGRGAFAGAGAGGSW